MAINVELAEAPTQLRRYKVQYPLSAYTFPQEACIHRVWFAAERLHVELTDGREVAIPLWWIPTLHNAAPEDREKYEINQGRTMITWNPDQCGINDELRIADYLAAASPGRCLRLMHHSPAGEYKEDEPHEEGRHYPLSAD